MFFSVFVYFEKMEGLRIRSVFWNWSNWSYLRCVHILSHMDIFWTKNWVSMNIKIKKIGKKLQKRFATKKLGKVQNGQEKKLHSLEKKRVFKWAVCPRKWTNKKNYKGNVRLVIWDRLTIKSELLQCKVKRKFELGKKLAHTRISFDLSM